MLGSRSHGELTRTPKRMCLLAVGRSAIDCYGEGAQAGKKSSTPSFAINGSGLPPSLSITQMSQSPLRSVSKAISSAGAQDGALSLARGLKVSRSALPPSADDPYLPVGQPGSRASASGHESNRDVRASRYGSQMGGPALTPSRWASSPWWRGNVGDVDWAASRRLHRGLCISRSGFGETCAGQLGGVPPLVRRQRPCLSDEERLTVFCGISRRRASRLASSLRRCGQSRKPNRLDKGVPGIPGANTGAGDGGEHDQGTSAVRRWLEQVLQSWPPRRTVEAGGRIRRDLSPFARRA